MEKSSKTKKYHSFGTVKKSYRKIVTKEANLYNTHIHHRSLTWLGTSTSRKSGGVR